MKWLIANIRQYRKTIAEIKNDFDNTFRQDVFIMKGSEPLNLPDGVDHIFERSCCWYVMVAVQIPGRLVVDLNMAG